MPHETLVHALRQQAEFRPEQRLFFDGTKSLSYAESWAQVDTIAGGLLQLGLKPGDRFAVLLPNGIDYLLLWLAAARAGLVAAYVNPALIGDVLLHQLRLIDASVAILDPSLADYLKTALRETGYTTIVDLRELPEGEPPADLPLGHHAMALYFTSGTTGPSKAVLYGHGQAVATALPMAETLSAEDVFFWFNPMFHVAVPHFIGASIIAGASVAVAPTFSASRFWESVRVSGATATMMLGAVAPILSLRDLAAADQNHPLRKVYMVPLIDRLTAFEARFGVKAMSWFNMTEVSTPLHTYGFERADDRSCGRLRKGVEARLVDDFDACVPEGQPGELVLRFDQPWEGSLGYWQDPDATVSAWRNLWFHTGDVFTVDSEGNYHFVDRKKDVIRRRGENISASEVEISVLSHPDVVEVAAVGVPSDLADEDLLVVVAIAAECSLQPDELHSYLTKKLARHMLPRYVRLQREGLPKTPTGKVRKGPLREHGAAGSWDSEAAGG